MFNQYNIYPIYIVHFLLLDRFLIYFYCRSTASKENFKVKFDSNSLNLLDQSKVCCRLQEPFLITCLYQMCKNLILKKHTLTR